MTFSLKLAGYRRVLSRLVRRPQTARESFGFIAAQTRLLPRRDDIRCTGCGACNERCSSGATDIVDEGIVRTVTIESLRCIFCARCADICPEKALDLRFEPLMQEAGSDGQPGEIFDDSNIPISTARKFAGHISLSHTIHEPAAVVNTTLELQRCRVCGEIMPVTGKQLAVIADRVSQNLEPSNAAIVSQDMTQYLTACISCRRANSVAWNTHPRKFV